MFGVASDPVAAAAAAVNYPASPSSGLDYIPSNSGVGPYATQASISAPVLSLPVPVLNNPQSYVSPTTGLTYATTAASATSPLGGLSTSTVLLGGLGILAVVLLSMKKR